MSDGDFLKLLERRDELNRLAYALARVAVYQDVTVPIPKPSQQAEIAFIKLVSWLYAHHFEAGLVSVRFLVGLFDGYDIDGAQTIRVHPTNVNALRTELQHNLLRNSESDDRTKSICATWYRSACGTVVPATTGQWRRCLKSLLKEAIAFFQSLDSCVRHLESDSDNQSQFEIWKRRLDRDHHPHEFDQIIREVAEDIGREELDPVRFRSRHLDKWRREISMLADGYDFKREGRRLVEASIVLETLERPPLTGQDLIREFSLTPGPLGKV